jgi:hypothetical protein
VSGGVRVCVVRLAEWLQVFLSHSVSECEVFGPCSAPAIPFAPFPQGAGVAPSALDLRPVRGSIVFGPCDDEAAILRVRP